MKTPRMLSILAFAIGVPFLFLAMALILLWDLLQILLDDTLVLIGVSIGILGLCVFWFYMGIRLWHHTLQKPATITLTAIFLLLGIVFNGALGYGLYGYLAVTPSAQNHFPWAVTPYLTWDADPATSVTVNWVSAEREDTQMEYTTDPENPALWISSEGENFVRMHRIHIQNLQPSTVYYYRVKIEGLYSEIWNFTTGPISGSDNSFRFLVFGDSQNGGGSQDAVLTNLTRAALQSGPFQFSIHCGDVVDQGNDLPSWKYTLDHISQLARSSPFQAAVGNHDLGDKYNSDPDSTVKYPDQGANWRYFFDYPYVPAGNPFTTFQNRYYAYTYANAHFIVIDTERDGNFNANSAQARWIEDQLIQASTNPDIDWIFCYYHRPVFCQMEGNGRPFEYLDEKNDHFAWLCPLFDRYGVDAVFQGHVHDYQAYNWTLDERVPFFNPEIHTWTHHSTLYFVTGGAANQYNRDELYTPNSEYFLGGQFTDHYLSVAINGTQATISALYPNNDLMPGQVFHLNK